MASSMNSQPLGGCSDLRAPFIYLQGVFKLPRKIIITEKELLYRLECPLRWATLYIMQESPILTCAEETVRWLIAEQLGGRVPSAKETLAFFDSEWNQTAYFQSKNGIPQKEYQLRLREGVRACRRLRDIVFRCEILQGVTPYELPAGNLIITGEYAVLRSSRRKKHAFALYLRRAGVKIKRLVPNLVSFARRLDLGNRWIDPANRNWGIESVGVMHYWLTGDLSAEHRPDLNFATDVVLGASSAITGSPFPQPGKHCLSCPTRACRPDDLACPPVSPIQNPCELLGVLP